MGREGGGTDLNLGMPETRIFRGAEDSSRVVEEEELRRSVKEEEELLVINE